jgi:GTP-binding protein
MTDLSLGDDEFESELDEAYEEDLVDELSDDDAIYIEVDDESDDDADEDDDLVVAAESVTALDDLDEELEVDVEGELAVTSTPTRRLPMVVVAGRPNVGKSSLVNRIVGERAAVVEEEPGVTRDRKVLTAEWVGTPFDIMDTGGWLAGGNALDAKVSQQAETALSEADVILLVVDVTVGVTDEDLAAAKVIRRAGPPVRLVVNKVDDTNREAASWEFVSLGVGDPFPVSALHGRGTGDMLDEIVKLLPEPLPTEEQERDAASRARTGPGGTPRVAIIGRPNVGKSTLFNKLIGAERSVVHDMPGTTVDAIDTVVETKDGPVCFIDTAGLRRPSRTERGTEHHAVLRALRALERADIAMLVIDATIGASHQDQRLAERIGVSGCPAIVVLNKWDLINVDDRDDVLAGVGDRLAFLGSAPVLKMSAKSGKGVHRILPALRDSVEAYHQRVPTGSLNRALAELQLRQSAPRARIRYIVQGAIDPPTFTRPTSATSSGACARSSNSAPPL